MTGYQPEELAAGFEFKILRSATGRFKDPEFLRQSLADEAEAGWTLVEKFDNSRLRLKRPMTARSRDAALTFDPYRTSVGITENQLGLVIAGTIVGVVACAGLVVWLSQR